jgi:hypothetical protein
MLLSYWCMKCHLFLICSSDRTTTMLILKVFATDNSPCIIAHRQLPFKCIVTYDLWCKVWWWLYICLWFTLQYDYRNFVYGYCYWNVSLPHIIFVIISQYAAKCIWEVSKCFIFYFPSCMFGMVTNKNRFLRGTLEVHSSCFAWPQDRPRPN